MPAQQEAVVDQHGVVARRATHSRDAERGDAQVEVARDPAAVVVGEDVRPDVAGGVEVVGQRVADVVVGQRSLSSGVVVGGRGRTCSSVVGGVGTAPTDADASPHLGPGRQAGQAPRSLRQVSSSGSGRTRVSATDGHEVGVARPAGQHVDVEVVGHAGARRPARG